MSSLSTKVYKYLSATVIAVVLVGCASNKAEMRPPEPTYLEQQVTFEAQARERLASGEFHTVEHGIVTVATIRERSDIIVQPPSVQYVVWQRDGIVVRGAAQEKPMESAPRKTADTKKRTESWPLLSEDLNFDSEIGRVEMCKNTDGCTENATCNDLKPCMNPERYLCYRVKQGDYCLEK